MKPTKEEVIAIFGVDPDAVGCRPRGWWIVPEVGEEERQGNAEVGDLCVKTRDGASNPIDPDAFRVGNCVGTAEDGFDRTYRYYYYRRLEALDQPAPDAARGDAP
jgi:hypothetical protein